MAQKRNNKIVTFIIINIILDGIIIFSLLAGGIIITDGEWFFYQKKSFTFNGILVDTRSWGVSDYTNNPRIAEILLKRGYNKVLENMKL